MKVGFSFEPGQKVGFVAAKGDGLLQSVVGLFIASEGAFVILAIPERLLSSEERPLETLIIDKIKFHFVKIPKPDITTDFTGWEKASSFVDVPPLRQLMKFYHQKEEEPGAPTTDSMASASSGLNRSNAEVERLQKELEAAHRSLSLMQRTAPKVAAKVRRQARGSLSFDRDETNDWAHRVEEEESEADDDIEDEQDEALLSNLELKMAGVWTDEVHAAPLKKPIKKTEEEMMNEMLGQRDGGKGTYQRLAARLRARAEPAETEEDNMKQLLTKGGGDQDKLLQLMVLHVMKKLVDKEDEDGTGGVAGGGKAFKRVHALRSRVFKNPQQVVSEYFMELMEKMGGVEGGDAWQVRQWTGKISWGKFKGLHRVHYHLGHALTLSLRGQHRESQAYMVQLLRSIHQVNLDGGGWETASLLLPKSRSGPAGVVRRNAKRARSCRRLPGVAEEAQEVDADRVVGQGRRWQGRRQEGRRQGQEGRRKELPAEAREGGRRRRRPRAGRRRIISKRDEPLKRGGTQYRNPNCIYSRLNAIIDKSGVGSHSLLACLESFNDVDSGRPICRLHGWLLKARRLGAVTPRLSVRDREGSSSATLQQFLPSRLPGSPVGS